MTAALNAKCSGAWRAADGVPVTIVSVAGRAATVELGEPAAGYKVGRTVTLPASWITDDAPPVEPADPAMGTGAYFTPAAVVEAIAPQLEPEPRRGVCPTCGRLLA